MFNSNCCEQIKDLAAQPDAGVMKIKTMKEMTVFDLMTGGDASGDYINLMNQSTDTVEHPMRGVRRGDESIIDMKTKLEEYGDTQLQYEDIAMPEIEVLVYFGNQPENSVTAQMKLKRVIRLDTYFHIAFSKSTLKVPTFDPRLCR